MARISLDPPRTLLFRAGEWYSRRRYGDVLEPGRALAHQPKVLLTYLRLERGVGRWASLDPTLKQLAVMAAAARVGCSWCLDFGYWTSQQAGLDPEKVGAVPQWRDRRDLFTPLEVAVLCYAEAMSDTPPTVSDALAADLVAQVGEAAFVELTAAVAVENLWSRTNSAFGLVGQGFAQRCAVTPVGAGVPGAAP